MYVRKKGSEWRGPQTIVLHQQKSSCFDPIISFEDRIIWQGSISLNRTILKSYLPSFPLGPAKWTKTKGRSNKRPFKFIFILLFVLITYVVLFHLFRSSHMGNGPGQIRHPLFAPQQTDGRRKHIIQEKPNQGRSTQISIRAKEVPCRWVWGGS